MMHDIYHIIYTQLEFRVRLLDNVNDEGGKMYGVEEQATHNSELHTRGHLSAGAANRSTRGM